MHGRIKMTFSPPFQISAYFEDVKVTTLDLGPKLPQIISVSTPWQDDLGLWVDVDIEYNSICQATVQTQGIRLPAKDEPDREAAELLRYLVIYLVIPIFLLGFGMSFNVSTFVTNSLSLQSYFREFI